MLASFLDILHNFHDLVTTNNVNAFCWVGDAATLQVIDRNVAIIGFYTIYIRWDDDSQHPRLQIYR